MARGRMVNRTISESKQVADLADRVSCAGALFWTWMIPHLDREGRISGNPWVLKGKVCPRIKVVTPGLVEETLAVAQELGLIILYEVDGDLFVEFPKFISNQKGLRVDREAESHYPPPSAGVTPELVRSNSDKMRGNGIEENVKLKSEGKRKEGELSDFVEQNPHPPSKNEGGNVLSVFKHYRKYHRRAHPKPKSGSKEWGKVKARLAEGYTTDDLMMAIDGCHKSPYHQGENERGKKYDSLELIVRDGDHVNQFIEIAEEHKHGPPPALSEKEKRSVRAGKQFIDRMRSRDAE